MRKSTCAKCLVVILCASQLIGCNWFLYGDAGRADVIEYGSIKARIDRIRGNPRHVISMTDLFLLMNALPSAAHPRTPGDDALVREVGSISREIMDALRASPPTGTEMRRSGNDERPLGSETMLDRNDLAWFFRNINAGVNAMKPKYPKLAEVLSNAVRPPESDQEAVALWKTYVR